MDPNFNHQLNDRLGSDSAEKQPRKSEPRDSTPRCLVPMHEFLGNVSSSTDHNAHSRWNLERAFEDARIDTDSLHIYGDRNATIYTSSDIELDAQDMRIIAKLVTTDQPLQAEIRSVFFDAIKKNDEVYQFQIKGIVYDSQKPPATYDGDGWPNRNGFADRRGKACRYDVPKDAHGTCSVREAVNEFNMTRDARRRTAGKAIRFPLPVAWGTFDLGEFDGEAFGFVVLGLPACKEVRKQIYKASFQRLIKSSDFTPMARVLKLRTAAIRTMHDAGIIAPYRHMDNVSIATDGRILMHDMGDPRALLSENLYSEAQFCMETYMHLLYALSPPNIIPQPKTEEELLILAKYIDSYTRAGLSGYYGEENKFTNVPYDEWHSILEESFQTPLSENSSDIATHHCRLFRNVARKAGLS